jgi:hypothetical protein
MAAELVTGPSQLRLISLYAECSKQFGTGNAGELFQVATQSRTLLVIRDIGDRRPCGDDAEPLIEGSQFA